ncbi:MAG: alpha-L-rhamnosidase C-terminal domain-containing protein, partial [Planctomycetota bacterium]
TDCPQRDERLGWTGDAQVYVNAACLNADSQAFFDKWLVDLVDAQRGDGQFPMVAPLKVAGGDGGPAWADAGVICPVAVYDHYGDRSLLARQYPSMKRFVDFCWSRSRDGGLAPKKFHCFGDWLSIKADTPKDVIYTAYLARSTALLAYAAEELGREADAEKYRSLFDTAKASFNRAYVSPDGKIKGDTQCVYALAITCDLLDDEMRQKASDRLTADITARDGRLSTGFVGTKDLLFALSQTGHDDIAHRLLHNEGFPGWGFSIKHGATSIWERWDGWTADDGFQSAGMNSFAHYSFGAVYHWMVEHVGGIHRDAVGYERVVIRPDFDPSLSSAETRYDSIRGTIATKWARGAEGLRLEVVIPCDTTAEVHLPAKSVESVLEGGRPAATAEGIRSATLEGGEAVLTVGSGDYAFSVKEEE